MWEERTPAGLLQPLVLTAVWNESRYTGSVFLIPQKGSPSGEGEEGRMEAAIERC